jgi:hypothetical protein
MGLTARREKSYQNAGRAREAQNSCEPQMAEYPTAEQGMLRAVRGTKENKREHEKRCSVSENIA